MVESCEVSQALAVGLFESKVMEKVRENWVRVGNDALDPAHEQQS